MATDLKDFWQRLQTGVEVAVAGSTSDKLLGVRDGFLRFFHQGLERRVSVAVVPQTVEELPLGLLISDVEVVRLARERAAVLETELAAPYHFYAAVEAGLQPLDVDDRHAFFLRHWVVLRGPLGESWGSSGSIQLPDRLVAGLDSDQLPFAIPGTRKRGGMTSSLTGGLETRREATAEATLHALSTLFFSSFEERARR
jgi:non-canonical (house-cleaning) NTP pyrophosphatase